MKYTFILLICFFTGLQLFAQDYKTIDSKVFKDVVFAKPNPPKAIKGWEVVELENGVSALVGEYPGKIIKFQFKVDAVGIEVEATQEAGIIEYSIDASEWEKLDLYKNTDENKSLYFTIGKVLKNRRHTLQIRMTGDKNKESSGNKCVIRHFYYNAPE